MFILKWSNGLSRCSPLMGVGDIRISKWPPGWELQWEENPGKRPVTQISQCASPISHNAAFVTEICTHVHISVTKWCIAGYGTGALRDLWEGLSISDLKYVRFLSWLSWSLLFTILVIKIYYHMLTFSEIIRMFFCFFFLNRFFVFSGKQPYIHIVYIGNASVYEFANVVIHSNGFMSLLFTPSYEWTVKMHFPYLREWNDIHLLVYVCISILRAVISMS